MGRSSFPNLFFFFLLVYRTVMRIAFTSMVGSGFWDRRLGLRFMDNELYCLWLEITRSLSFFFFLVLSFIRPDCALLINPVATCGMGGKVEQDMSGSCRMRFFNAITLAYKAVLVSAVM
jgi:hypothetical protein